MKKKAAIFLVCILWGAVAVSAGSEQLASYGISYGNVWEKSYGSSWRIQTLAFDVDIFQFWNGRNIGLYGNFDVGIPLKTILDDQNIPMNEMRMALEISMGPGFRIPLSDTLEILAGAGVHVSYVMYSGEETIGNTTHLYNRSIVGAGLGGTAAVKVDLSASVYFSGGIGLAYDFFGYNSRDSEKAEDFSAFTLKPFVGFGFSRVK